MADLIITERSDIVAIANAVRNKTGDTKELTLNGIVNGINGIDIATEPVLQNKTVTPKTSSQTVKADSGYDGLNQVTVNAMPTATQATPAITVNASGLITATATQTAGYVSAGTKTSSHQLAFQPAKTITPSAASQIAVSSGYFTGGNVMVAGDSNLVAGNIKSGISIFGVRGTYAGSGGDTSVEDGLITKTISGAYVNDRVTSIGSSAFAYCYSLTTASFPKVTSIGSDAFCYCSKLTSASFPTATTIGSYAFYYCSKLTTVSFPKVTSIGSNAFYNCSSLTTASFPKVTSIGSNAFYYCYSLTTASFPKVTSIGINAFFRCYNLKSLYLTGSSLCKLSNSNAFTSTPIGGYSKSAGTYGSIYVPASLLASYKTATNWTYFSSRFVGI